jgi:peptidyl serine alpha-galactosyltransferase
MQHRKTTITSGQTENSTSNGTFRTVAPTASSSTSLSAGLIRSSKTRSNYSSHVIRWATNLFLLTLFTISISFILVTFKSKTTTTSSSTTPIRTMNPEIPKDAQKYTKYHVVFSTGCSIYQDWQSYVFFYQAYAIQQGGTVTRIVSGCNEEEQVQLQKLFDEQIRTMVYDTSVQYNNNFRIHFTPDYSHLKPSEKYVYFNKPYGMKHWLENVLGYSSKITNQNTVISTTNVKEEDKNSIVVLLDPDQIIMRKWENNDFSNTDWKYLKQNEIPRIYVSDGYPMGQLYGYGLQWKQKINMTTVLNSIPNNGAGVTTPIDSMSNTDAQAGYVVGPPYVATATDMYKIVVTWSQFVVPVHDQYPHLLAEMFAYSLAAAHLQLHHQTAQSFMVTDYEDDRHEEGWNDIDTIPKSDLCTSHRIVRQEHIINNKHPIDQPMHRANTNGPWVFHYCQRYSIGPYFFGKYRMARSIYKGSFLNCDSPLFVEPPTNVYELYNYSTVPDGGKHTKDIVFRKDNFRRRAAFTMCYIIPFLNDAATYYKQKHCTGQVSNYSKIVRLAYDD